MNGRVNPKCRQCGLPARALAGRHVQECGQQGPIGSPISAGDLIRLDRDPRVPLSRYVVAVQLMGKKRASRAVRVVLTPE